MPSKITKKRRQAKLQQQQLERPLQPRRLAGSETSEHHPSTSYESMPGTSSASQDMRESLEGLEISPRETQTPRGTEKGLMRLVLKPPPSQFGSRYIGLISNHYPLKIKSMLIYHYDVTITNLTAWKESEDSALPTAEATSENVETLEYYKKKYRCLNTKINRKLLQMIALDGQLEDYVYDGKKNMFTRHKNLILLSKEIPFKDDFERKCLFKIEIKQATKPDRNDNSINLEILNRLFQGWLSYIPEDAVLALRTILRNQPAMTHIPIGRSFFPFYGREQELSGGRLVKKGYHQSVLMTQSNAVLNIDTAATTFYQPISVIEFLQKLLDMMAKEENERRIQLETIPELNGYQIKRMASELIGRRIYATHFEPHRKYKVHGVSENSADKEIFKLNKREISITDYFKKTYNISLLYGRFPCLQVSKKRDIYMPLEVCEIPEGEPCLRKPSKLQTSEIIQCTTLPPQARFSEIQKTVDYIREETSFVNELGSFGITINNKPVEVNGLLLDSPELLYRRSTRLPLNGQWNVVNSTLRIGVDVKKWAILAASSNIEPKLRLFATKLKDTANKFGLNMQPASRIISARNPRDNLSDLLKGIYESIKDIELVVVVLKSKNDKNYSKIKYVAENELGIITQCLDEKNILDDKKCNEQFLVNLCLKINGKLGGQNSIINTDTLSDILEESTMIIGADCNHPGPNDEITHSIAAVVCNLDPEMAKFATACTIQSQEKNKRIELMKKLKDMVIELLKLYYRKRKKYPRKIIFFRDGVSEGEYVKALNEEVPQVQEACKDVIRGECPKITFLIVNKRHHTRFMVKNPETPSKQMGSKQPQGNLPPGTKVDTGVTHVLNFDFFLCSHKAIKGTSRPAHYTVIYDDNNFSSSENKPKLEKLCYFLCHISARSTRSISIPAPVAYADLAAYRAKQYLLAAPSVKALVAEWSDGIKVATKICDQMYFI